MRTETSQQQQTAPTPDIGKTLDGRAALAAARREDHAWRTHREVRAKKILQRIESVTTWGVLGLYWVMLAMAAVGGGSLLIGIGFTFFTNDLLPEWTFRTFMFGVVGLGVAGLLAVGGYFVGQALSTGMRRWAARQALDLSEESETGVRFRRRRRRTP